MKILHELFLRFLKCRFGEVGERLEARLARLGGASG
jgi:hypothetical protein